VNERYAAIILAGRLSTRMKQFKPLLPLDGETITDRVITTFLSAGVDVFLVTGHRHDDIIKGIKKYNITIVHNPDYKKGMFSSIQAGVSHLKPLHKGFFILPVDIPLVRIATVRSLMEAALENPDNIIYPTFGGKRGHPPLIPSSLAPAILEWGKSGGLKGALESYEKLARDIPVSDSFILFDIDTPEDYQKLLKSYRELNPST